MRCEAVAPPSTALASAVSAAQLPPSLAQTVALVEQQSGGAVMLQVVDASVWAELTANPENPNPVARAVRVLVGHALTALANDTPDALKGCACCGRLLVPHGYNLVAVLPSRPDPDSGLTLAICVGCGGGTVPEVEAATWAALRAIWPALRPLPMVPGVVGHA